MTAQEIRETLKTALIKELRLEDLTPQDIDDDATLFGDDGLGLDSLDAVELVVLVEKLWGIAIADAEEARTIFGSVAQLADYIAAQRHTGG